MPFELIHWSKPHLSQTGKSTVQCATASEAWHLYQSLTMSDEMVEVKTSGREVGWQELRMLAEQESKHAPRT